MDHIQKYSKIRKTALSQEFYLQSLLREAYAQAEISDSKLDRIQTQCIALLAASVKRYSKEESSSVRLEVAQAIMASNLYTIGAYLKSLPDPSSALESVKGEQISELYRKGRSTIDSKMDTAKQLYALVRSTRIQNPNYTYNATIEEGLEGFFQQYDVDYAAHETPASIDYQLLNPVAGLAGVEYMVQYLQNLHIENLFCNKFEPTTIDEVMRGYDKTYKDLLINICGQVLQNALGCAVLGKDVLSLSLVPSDIQRLKSAFKHLTVESICDLLRQKAKITLETLAIRDESLKPYISFGLPEMASRIHSAMSSDTLDTIFVPRRSHETRTIAFSMGVKMRDEVYRDVVKELLVCSDSRDKIRIIMENIKTLADMEDVIRDGALNEAEALAVFRMLDDVEIAVLLRRHPYYPGIDEIDYSESEMRLRRYLETYLQGMPERKQSQIREACRDSRLTVEQNETPVRYS